MIFDISNIDKVLLLQTLYIHADPKGRGVDHYNWMLRQGATVEGLSDNECRQLFSENERNGYFLLDYVNGKPLKVDWSTNVQRPVLAPSFSYDRIHGKYRFLEAMLNIFDPEDIIITQREYYPDGIGFLTTNDSEQKEAFFENIVEKSVMMHDGNSIIWKLNMDGFTYRSSFLRGLGL